jgi:hypothetical protein
MTIAREIADIMQRWIKFDKNDELAAPNHGDDVLALFITPSGSLMMDVCTYDNSVKMFYSSDDNSERVTHWQPLPEPPED